MSLETIWSLAAVTESLAALAVLGLCGLMMRRANRTREAAAFLAMLLALAAHFGLEAADAFAHCMGGTEKFTLWAGGAQVMQIYFWSLLCVYLLLVVSGTGSLNSRTRMVIRTAGMVVVLFPLLSTIRLVLAMRQFAAGQAAHAQATLAYMFHGSLGLFWLWIIAPQVLQGFLRVQVPSSLPARDFKAIAGVLPTGILLAILALAHVGQKWTTLGLGVALVARLLLLPSLLGIIYYQTRFIYFDVVLKRAVLMAALAGLVIPAMVLAAPVLLSMHSSVGQAMLASGAVVLAWLAALDAGSAGGFVDKVVFHRPDYRAELQALATKMAECDSPDTLQTTFTTELRRALGAEFVRFSAADEERKGEARLIVRVGQREHLKGYLVFGERRHGLSYRSEDLTFLDAAVAQLVAQLESLDTRQAQQLAAAAEMRALRAQVNPHFLFNSLNTLADMAKEVPEAEQTILNLARVFRYALEATKQERVELDDELAALRAYLEIEKARFEDRLNYEIAASQAALAALVPPMLLQPLVENAIRHGMAGRPAGGTIRVSAQVEAGRLRMAVCDDGAGFEPSRAMGVGLGGVLARVKQAGGSLRIDSAPGAGTRIEIEVAAHASVDRR
ncbi:MAG: histidine kinase [Acidobacteria bacterium]|nr:histidine kinase [Acidobacteriota bacterium]